MIVGFISEIALLLPKPSEIKPQIGSHHAQFAFRVATYLFLLRFNAPSATTFKHNSEA